MSPLGTGGNSEVWRVSGDDGRSGALKVSKHRRGDRLARFLDEIEFLVDPGPGVLPLIDLAPEGARDPLWYVTPEAIVLSSTIGDDVPAVERVTAVRDIACTLAGLAERGIGHRDIKPENLFLLDGKYLVGDFGLVSYPEKAPVTKAGRKLGPIDYMAPEMRVDADTAAAGPADVYSLAKTLWVLLTGHVPPLPGPHRVDDMAYALETYVAGTRLRTLDLLLERCTHHVPDERPTMADVANELEAWLLPPRPEHVVTLADIAARVGGVSEPGIRAEAALQRRSKLFDEAWEQARQSLEPLAAELEQAFPIVRHHRNPHQHVAFAEVPVARRHATYGVYATNADAEPVELYLALAVQWGDADDVVQWGAWARVEDPYAGPRTLWKAADSAPLGSARQDQVVTGLVSALSAQLRDFALFAVGRMELRGDANRHASWTGAETEVGPLAAPWSIFSPSADGDAGCFVVDSGNDRIVRFGPGGRGLGWRGPGAGDRERLRFPAGGCFTHDRRVWIADHDNRRIRYFSEHGEPLEGLGLTARDELMGPADVASGPDGSVYVVDRIRDVVVKYGPGGSPVVEWGGTGRTEGQLSVPCGIAVRHGAFVYVSDSGNDRIQKFTSSGDYVATWGGVGSAQGYFHAPHGIALDIEENVYVADCDNHRVQQFTSEGKFIRCWGANGGDGTPGDAPGQFVQPRGVSIDGRGDVYVAEFGAGRVQRCTRSYLEAL